MKDAAEIGGIVEAFFGEGLGGQLLVVETVDIVEYVVWYLRRRR